MKEKKMYFWAAKSKLYYYEKSKCNWLATIAYLLFL